MVYLNEQKVTSLTSAAVLPDEYVLIHKSSSTAVSQRSKAVLVEHQLTVKNSSPRKESSSFYCHRTGHVIADCLTLKCQKQESSAQPKEGGLIQAETHRHVLAPYTVGKTRSLLQIFHF